MSDRHGIDDELSLEDILSEYSGHVPLGNGPREEPEEEPAPAPEEESTEPAIEDVVARTVDAVREDRRQRQQHFLKKLKKARRKADPKARLRKDSPVDISPELVSSEIPVQEAQLRYKIRYRQCRTGLRLSVPVLLLLWLPLLLSRLGVAIPFYGQSEGNAVFVTLALQAVICCLCWPLFPAALERRAWTFYAMAVLLNLVTLLDEITLLLLPQRADVQPLGGVAAVVNVAALWGLTGYHRGLWESMRVASLGRPAAIADCREAGVGKGPGPLQGFSVRCAWEDSSALWQRLLLPVLTVASLIFALLSTVGQGKGQNFFWCWSAILATSTSLVFPLTYPVPFGRLAAHLGHSGTAVAGELGAQALSRTRALVVTDDDLFPPGTVSLTGLKLYGEERAAAIAYAAALAIPGGGGLGRAFKDVCLSEGVHYPEAEHFHIHEDGGLSGMLHGETVLLGSPVFMRHKAVRLPPTLPSKNAVCLAVDGELTAAFAVKYTALPAVRAGLKLARNNGLQIVLAMRDGNVTAKLLKTVFGSDFGAVSLEVDDRMAYSDPQRTAGDPNGILCRDGLYPYVDLAAGCHRLCHVIRLGNVLSLTGSVVGTLLGYYLTFTGTLSVLTPPLILTFLLLWAVPMLPVLWGVDKP